MRPFKPIVTNPHLLTIAAGLWPRKTDERRFPVTAKLFQTEPDARILIHVQEPGGKPRGDVLLLHGLEGSSDSGYMCSLAQTALEHGFATHRLNLRGCGGTEFLAPTMYNGGMTSDLFAYLMHLDRHHQTPVFLVGFSLGGSVALKMAGELGGSGDRLLGGVCAVSTPIDLGVCARAIGERRNRRYERRFLKSMKNRVLLKHKVLPSSFALPDLDTIQTLYDFDDKVTAPLGGFRDADHYYSTQSAARFLSDVRVPTLLIQAKDDPMIPFSLFSYPGIASNPDIELLATEHGGHMGFLSRTPPWFWLDEVVVAWIMRKEQALRSEAVI